MWSTDVQHRRQWDIIPIAFPERVSVRCQPISPPDLEPTAAIARLEPAADEDVVALDDVALRHWPGAACRRRWLPATTARSEPTKRSGHTEQRPGYTQTWGRSLTPRAAASPRGTPGTGNCRPSRPTFSRALGGRGSSAGRSSGRAWVGTAPCGTRCTSGGRGAAAATDARTGSRGTAKGTHGRRGQRREAIRQDELVEVGHPGVVLPAFNLTLGRDVVAHVDPGVPTGGAQTAPLALTLPARPHPAASRVDATNAPTRSG